VESDSEVRIHTKPEETISTISEVEIRRPANKLPTLKKQVTKTEQAEALGKKDSTPPLVQEVQNPPPPILEVIDELEPQVVPENNIENSAPSIDMQLHS
jgi:hypothetical protein